MDLASHRSVTEVSAVQQLLERWAAYDNRCLNRRIVGWLPWKQMLKTLPLATFSLFPCSPFCSPSVSLSFLNFFFFDPLWLSLHFDHFDLVFIVPLLFSLSHAYSFTYLPPLLSLSPQLHPQWELFLRLAFCERATRSASPALSLGTLCKSVCVYSIDLCWRDLPSVNAICAPLTYNIMTQTCYMTWLYGSEYKQVHPAQHVYYRGSWQ